MAKKATIDAAKPLLNANDAALDTIEEFLDKLDKGVDVATDVVENGLEKVADVVPDALDTTVHVSTKGGRKLVRFFRDPKHTAVTIVITSTLVGAGLGLVGYKLMKKRLEQKLRAEYDEVLESEIAEMRRFYAMRNKDGFDTPQQAVEKLMTKEAAEALGSYQGKGGEPQNLVTVEGPPVVHTDEEESELTIEQRREALKAAGYTETQIAEVLGVEPVDIRALQAKMRSGTPVEITEVTSPHNIFADGHPVTGEEEEFNYEDEVRKRTPDAPYIITHEEFMTNENDWEQHSVTYFNGDDTLVDDQTMPIPDIEDMVGSENLARFGQGSKDPRIVYVRNEEKEMDFEIRLDDGEFGKLAGFGSRELRHSAPRRRFRDDDE